MKVNEVYLVDVHNKGRKTALFPFLVFFLIFKRKYKNFDDCLP